jgi:hypothetical protein
MIRIYVDRKGLWITGHHVGIKIPGVFGFRESRSQRKFGLLIFEVEWSKKEFRVPRGSARQ